MLTGARGGVGLVVEQRYYGASYPTANMAVDLFLLMNLSVHHWDKNALGDAKTVVGWRFRRRACRGGAVQGTPAPGGDG